MKLDDFDNLWKNIYTFLIIKKLANSLLGLGSIISRFAGSDLPENFWVRKTGIHITELYAVLK